MKGSTEETQIQDSVMKALKALRMAKGITQQELADILGTNMQKISSFERCKENPTINTLLKITNALDADIKIVPRQKQKIK